MPVHEYDVGADAGAVPAGRHFTSKALAGALADDVIDAAELVVTELLTNALLHGAPPVRLVVSTNEDTARIEVHDGSRALPVRPQQSAESMTGRGLALVDALSWDWGVVPAPDGSKAVWAELTPDSVQVAEPGEVDLDALLAEFEDEQLGAPVRLTVSLGDVPTALLLAAKAHVDAVVRELTLVATGAESGISSAVPASLAQLVHDVVTQFAEARQAIKRQALAAAGRGESRTTLRLTLPPDAAEAGERYLAALEEADAYGRASRLLTLAAPPQHAAFRRWYVTALVDGLRRAAAGEEVVIAPSFETFLLAEVDHLAELQEVSDRAARLQRITAALAGVLEREDVARITVDDAVSELRASRGVLLLPRGDAFGIGARSGYEAVTVDALHAAAARGAVTPAVLVRETGQAVWVENRDELVLRFPQNAALEPDVLATCAVPLSVAGHLVGVLRLSFDEPRLFTADERAFVAALAAVAAQALERADLYDARGSLADRLARLQEVTAALKSAGGASGEPSGALGSEATSRLVQRPGAESLLAALGDVALRLAAAATVDDLTSVVVRHGLTVLGADGAEICVRDDDRGVVRLSAAPSHGAGLMDGAAELPLDGPLPCSVTARTGRAVLLPTRRSAVDFTPELAAVHDRTGRSAWASLPLRAGGRLLGSLVVSWLQEQTFPPREQELLGAFAAQCAQALDRVQTLQAERGAALAARRLSETLQRSLLTTPPEPDHVEVAVRYVPAAQEAQVGGDWYDGFFTRDGSLNLVIGDCSGHDREAVAAMAAVRNLLRATAYAVDDQPAAVLTALEATMAGLDVTALATALLAKVEQTAEQRTRGVRTMVWSSAGHLPPLLRRGDGRCTVLRSVPDLLLGLMSDADRYDHQVELAVGATVLLYTDGLIERRGEDLDTGIERLRATLAEVGSLPLDQVCDELLRRLGADAEDDLALLAVRFHDEQAPR